MVVIIKADGSLECGAAEDYRGRVEVRKHTLLKANASIMLILWSVAIVYGL